MNPPRNDVSGTLFDNLIADFSLKNDAALAKFLDVAPPMISKTRHGKLLVGPTMIINIHERTGWTIKEIKDMIDSGAAA